MVQLALQAPHVLVLGMDGVLRTLHGVANAVHLSREAVGQWVGRAPSGTGPVSSASMPRASWRSGRNSKCSSRPARRR